MGSWAEELAPPPCPPAPLGWRERLSLGQPARWGLAPPCPGMWQGSSWGSAESGTTRGLFTLCCGAEDSQHPQRHPPGAPRGGQVLAGIRSQGPARAQALGHPALCQWLSTICPIPNAPGWVTQPTAPASLGAGWRWPQSLAEPGRAGDPQTLPSGQCQNAAVHGPPGWQG